MKKLKAAVISGALLVALATLSPVPASFAAASTYYMRAQVIPASYLAVGSALQGGENGTKYGYSLIANGISGTWSTTQNGTVHFVVLTFSSHAETGTVSFKVVGPNGGTVYRYSFGSEQVPAGADWFTLSAQGNYATPGLYFGEFFFGSSMIGWAPLNFTT
jgi:hypothetical protein